MEHLTTVVTQLEDALCGHFSPISGRQHRIVAVSSAGTGGGCTAAKAAHLRVSCVAVPAGGNGSRRCSGLLMVSTPCCFSWHGNETVALPASLNSTSSPFPQLNHVAWYSTRRR